MVDAAVWFGIGAAVFFLAVATFVAFGATRGDLTSPYYFVPPLHALIAGIAYVMMTLVSLGTFGSVVPEDIGISAFRYADWSLSTPLITYYLSMLAGVPTRTRVLAVVANVAVIWIGFGSLLVPGLLQWALFGVAALAFLGLLYLYLSTFSRAIEDNPESSRSLFTSLRDLTVGIWTLYPVVYVLGPHGVGVLQVADHHFVVVALDITAKVGLMTVMLVRQYELNTFVSTDTTAAPN